MSRALESEVTISDNTHTYFQVYKDIVVALSTNSSSASLLEIEFLGKSHDMPDGCNVLVDGSSIGIPKKKLIQAFVVARRLFFSYTQELTTTNDIDIRNATAVMLLMDAENLTAANTRKRLIRSCQGDELEMTLKQELRWVDGMLTSRLHRHTKSPTLWSHRRWILEMCQSIKMPHDIQNDLQDIVLVAAERHPRNYYAWLHIRWLLQNLHGKDTATSKHLDESTFISTVLDWCLRHPSDTSGFSFLLFCLNRFSKNTVSKSYVCKRVLDLSVSFQWTHESVWVFLRTLVALGEVEDQRPGFLKSIDSIVESQPDNSNARVILTRAQLWCIQYEHKPPLQVDDSR